MPYIWHRVKGSHHVGEILKVKKHSIPWAWMFISGFSTLAPLIVGTVRGESAISIFGSLTGYFIGLCDHRGHLSHRLVMATAATLVCWSGFCAGILVHDSLTSFIGLSVMLIYLTGLFSGRGGELERAFVFCGVEFFVSRYARSLTISMIPSLSLYFLVAYFVAFAGIFISRLTIQKEHADFTHIKQAMREIFTLKPSRHHYSVSYVLAILIGICCVERFDVPRGYWVMVTIVLIMKPDRKEGVYRIFQRFTGTFLGLMLGQTLIWIQPPILVLAGAVFVFATLVPLAWYRNYWLVAFCATNIVICLLSIAQYGHIEPALTRMRLVATGLGCAISLIVLCSALICNALASFVTKH